MQQKERMKRFCQLKIRQHQFQYHKYQHPQKQRTKKRFEHGGCDELQY